LAVFLLTGGNVNDCTQAQPLLEGISSFEIADVGSVTADKGYDSVAIVALVEALGAVAVIPQLATRKTPRPVDWTQYRNRNIVERFFARIKQFRRIATRYDKLQLRFASFVQLAAVYIWLV
jgi:transposase